MLLKTRLLCRPIRGSKGERVGKRRERMSVERQGSSWTFQLSKTATPSNMYHRGPFTCDKSRTCRPSRQRPPDGSWHSHSYPPSTSASLPSPGTTPHKAPGRPHLAPRCDPACPPPSEISPVCSKLYHDSCPTCHAPCTRHFPSSSEAHSFASRENNASAASNYRQIRMHRSRPGHSRNRHRPRGFFYTGDAWWRWRSGGSCSIPIGKRSPRRRRECAFGADGAVGSSSSMSLSASRRLVGWVDTRRSHLVFYLGICPLEWWSGRGGSVVLGSETRCAVQTSWPCEASSGQNFGERRQQLGEKTTCLTERHQNQSIYKDPFIAMKRKKKRRRGFRVQSRNREIPSHCAILSSNAEDRTENPRTAVSEKLQKLLSMLKLSLSSCSSPLPLCVPKVQ